MSELHVTARMRIHDGQLEAFKAASQACVQLVSANEPGALQYDWFFSADETECVAIERYADSNAVLAHMANVGEQLGALIGMSDFSVEVCGDPSDELRSASEGMPVKFYTFAQGL